MASRTDESGKATWISAILEIVAMEYLQVTCALPTV